MFPRLVLHVTPKTARAELTGSGVLLQQAAAILLGYRARSGWTVLAMGDDAPRVAERGLASIDTAHGNDDAEPFARIVSPEASPWWREDTMPSPSASFDPWDHNGEAVLLWPFAPETYAPQLCAHILCHLRMAALRTEGGAGVNGLLRWWLTWWASVEVRLQAPPPTAAARDALVREMARYRLRLHGGPARPAPRPLSQLSWKQWAMAALMGIGLPALLYGLADFKRMASPRAVLSMLALTSAGVAGSFIMACRREGARHMASREALAQNAVNEAAARRLEVLEPGEDAEGYAGVDTFRLGTQGAGEFLTPLVMLGLVYLTYRCAMQPLVLAWLSRASRPALSAVLILPLLVGPLLGEMIAGVRLSIGARGLSIRRLGLLGPRLFIPYSRIRSAVAVELGGVSGSVHALSILLRDGHDLRFPVSPLHAFWRRKKIARGAEEAILAQLDVQRPYRRPVG